MRSLTGSCFTRTSSCRCSRRTRACVRYWRDFDSLEQWARSTPHRDWWRGFLRDSGGTGFWHETYFMRGGMEAVYDDMVAATGFLKFAPVKPARGGMFSARDRARRAGTAATPPPISEDEVYR